jgi:hypothetical protein
MPGDTARQLGRPRPGRLGTSPRLWITVEDLWTTATP